jgi:flagellar biosynthesis protein FlhA
VLLTEYVRQAIRRAVVKPYLSPSGTLPAFFLDPAIEDAINAAVEHGEHHSHLNTSPQHLREVVEKIRKVSPSPDSQVVILTHSGVRYFLQHAVDPILPNVHFLSHSEVPPATRVQSIGVIQ